MTLRLALLSLLIFPAAGRHGPVRGEVHHLGPWTLRVSADRFANTKACSLSRHGVDYERRALVFHLPARIDTASAVYRIDGGSPFMAAQDLPELARQGFALTNDDLFNPTGGLVRIPADRLARARTVRIETRPRVRLFTFKIEGFDSALAAARRAGCYPEPPPPTASRP